MSTVVPLDEKRKQSAKAKEAKNQSILLETLELTELRVAKKFMLLEDNEYNWIYNNTRKKWMYWDLSQHIWIEDNEIIMYKKICSFVEGLSMEYSTWELDEKEWNQVQRAIINLQSAKGLKNIMNCCMSVARIISETDLDGFPYMINFKNGLYNLETNEFYFASDSNRCFLMTKRCNVNYNEASKCPLWERTLKEVFQNDTEYIDYFQRIFGYALLGKDIEHALFIIQGETRTGKTTVLNPIIKVMGDYYKDVPDDVLTDKGKDKALVLAEMYGMRFAHVAETEKGAKLVLSLLKRISGGNSVSGRRHHEQYFTYKPAYNIFIETNENPVIGDDNATWERIHNIKFERYFAPNERDTNLGDKLEKELEGILLWLLEGWKKYQLCRLAKPEKAVKDTQAHRDENDTLKHFINDCFNLTADENDYVERGDLFKIYCEWADRNKLSNADRLNGIQFGKDIKKRKEIHCKSKRLEKGIRQVYIGMELKRG